MIQPLAKAVLLEILRSDGRVQQILVDAETAERELDDWIEQERRWANSVVEQTDAGDFDPLGLNDNQKSGSVFDPNEFYVRRLAGLNIDGCRETTIAYRFQDVTSMQATRVV